MNSKQETADRHWIKPGMQVTSILNPKIVMIVDDIKKITKEVTNPENSNLAKVQKVFTIGVECHWVYNGIYQRGRFHTTELLSYDKGNKRKSSNNGSGKVV